MGCGSSAEGKVEGMHLTELLQYPTTKELNVALTAYWPHNDMVNVESLRIMEHWGKMVGCKTCILSGRTGWKKLVTAEGYGDFAISMRKVL